MARSAAARRPAEENGEAAAARALESRLKDRAWRLDNLYTVETKDGQVVPFRMNRQQRRFLRAAHSRNVILKARQLGFTTFICLLMLDACLFNSGLKCGVIAHHAGDAIKIFQTKIRDVYARLPDWLKKRRPRVAPDQAGHLTIRHGEGLFSVITVSTSLRSGTYQWLLVTEFGKICARRPAAAEEIVTGALNTVAAGQTIIIESTAEGAEGAFYDIVKTAQGKAAANDRLGALDFKYHFEPWFDEPGYVYDPDLVKIGPDEAKYFAELEAIIRRERPEFALSPEQKAWYIATKAVQGELMLREYPSTWEEAFKAAIEGAFYTQELALASQQKRLRPVPWEPTLPVHLLFDLGMDDYTSCIMVQIAHREVRVIDFAEWTGRGLESIVSELRNTRFRYRFGKWCLPHDAEVRSLETGEKRRTFMERLGCDVLVAQRPHTKADGIAAVRQIFPRLFFDESAAKPLWTHLELYKHEWDDRLGVWKATARHDEHCHAADALQTGALLIDQLDALESFSAAIGFTPRGRNA